MTLFGRYRVLLLSLSCLLFFTMDAQAATLRMVEDSNQINAYAKGLLRLALSKVPGQYEWNEATAANTEARMVQMLEDKQLDIVWYATTKEFEERLLPIRIPIYRGLLGYRILMIKKDTQHKFNAVKTLDDLRQFSLGQGRLWADTDVLTANGLNIIKVTKYNSLFFMLDGDRFDAFPRGVHEPWSEIENRPQLALDVEQNVLLVYTNPFYFFVNKANTELARVIEKGLRVAIEDGSFNEYFMNDPSIKNVINRANLKNRIIIRLQNPGLPELTPVDDKTLWFDPTEL